MAQELVRLKVEIIVAWGTDALLAAKNATTTIPIVIGSASDPVGSEPARVLDHEKTHGSLAWCT